MQLTTKLESFEPLYGFALVSYDLRLPEHRNRQKAHGNYAKDEHDADIGLVSGKAQHLPKPSHGWISPSTRSDLPAFDRVSPSDDTEGGAFVGIFQRNRVANSVRLLSHGK